MITTATQKSRSNMIQASIPIYSIDNDFVHILSFLYGYGGISLRYTMINTIIKIDATQLSAINANIKYPIMIMISFISIVS